MNLLKVHFAKEPLSLARPESAQLISWAWPGSPQLALTCLDLTRLASHVGQVYPNRLQLSTGGKSRGSCFACDNANVSVNGFVPSSRRQSAVY